MTTEAAAPPRLRGIDWPRIAREYAIIGVTLLLFVILAIASDPFLSKANLLNVLDQQSTVLIAGAATTLTLIAGGFDVSLSAVYILCGIIAIQFENATGSILLGILGGLAAGLAMGVVNGLVSTVGRINSFVATLATSLIFFGLGYVISGSQILHPENEGFSEFARHKVLGVAMSSWIAILVVAALWVLLDRTRFGRHVYAAGGNPEAARLAGVRVDLVRTATFAIGGLGASLAGILLASRTSTAQPSDSFEFIFTVIAAVIVGGTSIMGGEGAVWRTVFGAFFLAFLINGFNLLGVDPVYQRIIQGSVILGAVAVDAWSRSRR